MRNLSFAMAPLILAGGAAACGDSGDVAGDAGHDFEQIAGPVLTSFEIRQGPNTPEDEQWGSLEGALSGLVYLVEDSAESANLSGIVLLYGSHTPAIAEVNARRSPHGIEVGGTSIPVPGYLGELSWHDFELRLEDTTGDGYLDAGDGSFSGVVTSYAGGGGPISGGQITAAPDGREPTAYVRPFGTSPQFLLPFDEIAIHFTKPVIQEEIADGLRMVVDGEPVKYVARARPRASVEAGGEQVSLTARAVLTPAELIPPRAEIHIDTSGMADFTGRAVVEDEPIIAAPELAESLVNPSFADGTEHWLTAGGTEVLASFQDLEPAHDGAFAVLERASVLVGGFDLPAESEIVSLDLALWHGADIGEHDLTIDVVTATGVLVSRFDTSELEGQDVECSDCDWGYYYRTGPRSVALDVAAAAGERVFLRVSIPAFAAQTPPTRDAMALSPPPPIAAAVDRVEIISAKP